MLRKLANIVKNQKGFTLVEVIIAVAITGLIVGGLAMTIIQLFEGHAQSSGEMAALRQVQNAGYHVSRDAQMAAEPIDASDDPGTEDITEVLTIIWTEYDSWKTEPLDGEEEMISMITKHIVVYTLDDNRLDRDEYRTESIREDVPIEDIEYFLYSMTKVAEYITIFVYDLDNNSLTVTAETGGFRSQTETRTYEIEPRPDTIFWQ